MPANANQMKYAVPGGQAAWAMPSRRSIADLCLPVFSTEAQRHRSRRVCVDVAGFAIADGEREQINERGWELVQIRLHRPELRAAPEEEREVKASRVSASESVEYFPNFLRPIAELSERDRVIQRERPLQIEPPPWLHPRHLETPTCLASVRQPDRWGFGHVAGLSLSSCFPSFVARVWPASQGGEP